MFIKHLGFVSFPDAIDEMRYKTRYSESGEYTIYRYFHYTPRQLGIRGFLATTCAAIAFFCLVPLPDDVIIYPAIAKALQHIAPMEFKQATFYAIVLFNGIGVFFLCMTCLFGTQYLRDALLAKARMMKDAQKKMQTYVQNGHKNMQQRLARKR
jgi:hypothetical protein